MKERIDSIPSPRPAGGWVADQAGYLKDSGAITDINQNISLLEKETGAEIGVVILPTIGENIPKDFAVSLFETWGIGKKGKDNGILVLHVLDQRRIEIETGYGNEASLTDIKAKRIIDELIIPEFKQGNFSSGMYKGVNGIIKGIRNPDISVSQLVALDPKTIKIYKDLPIETYLSKQVESSEVFPATPIGPEKHGILYRIFTSPVSTFSEFFTFWAGLLLLFISILVGILLSFLPFGSSSIYKSYSYILRWIGWFSGITAFSSISISELKESDSMWGMFNLIPMGLAIYAINGWIFKRLRNNPRICSSCGAKQTKLSEAMDDKYLDAGERKEEEIDSKDYDIWLCKECNSITKESYMGASPADECPKCKYMTFQLLSVKVIREADYDQGGEELHHSKCAHCKHSESKRVTTPKLTRSSSSGSSSSSYGGGGGSSSGGSWGGGRSGGGGAGGSY
ncbi:TPM domain-containing protein [Leptospira idonii]|uniref:TPM domain-containing protein n=1 Tax=Leptospira idonii TaxID=1193500 RepID=UPI001438536C|nr:TPM domain-containing protein [Leptospira idonii]